jgi:hypothetical protein
MLQAWPMHERLAALSLLGFDGIEYIDGDYWLLFDGPIDAMLGQFFALGIELRLGQLQGAPLHAGTPRVLQVNWQLAASGDQQLQLRVEPDGVAIANTRYRRYLDVEQAAIGPVISDFDDAELAQLRDLPAVAPDEVEMASAVVAKLFPRGQLPLPQTLATTPASPIAPTAVVLIGGAPYLNRVDLLTQATAHLGFRYGRHEVRAGDRSNELRWRGDDGRVHVLARDVEAEARASQFLARHGFKPGSSHGSGGPAEHWYWNGRLKNGELQAWIANCAGMRPPATSNCARPTTSRSRSNPNSARSTCASTRTATTGSRCVSASKSTVSRWTWCRCCWRRCRVPRNSARTACA